MKKFKIIIGVVILYYIIAIPCFIYLLNHMNKGVDNGYKIEINRLSYRIKKDFINNDKFVMPDLSDMEYIKDVEYKERMDESFFESGNREGYEIFPVYHAEKIKGYVKVTYIKKTLLQKSYYLIIIIGIILLGVFTAGLLIYIKKYILNPFNKIRNLPEELAKGNLTNEYILEEKSKYLGKFIWGLGMLQDELLSAKKKELKFEKDKKMLVLSISHDIKTPLNAIRLYAKALQEGLYETDKEKEEAAGQIEAKTLEIENFVAEIVKTSSENILNIEVKEGEFYLKELMDKVIQNYRRRLQDMHTEFEVMDYSNKILSGDLDRSYEVVCNIIENACKYGDGRNISISFDEEEYCQLIRIHNTGSAIGDQDINHIFDSFYRGSNSEGKEGAGLGLYICRQIMRKMQGEIYCETKKDGMDFILVIPII